MSEKSRQWQHASFPSAQDHSRQNRPTNQQSRHQGQHKPINDDHPAMQGEHGVDDNAHEQDNKQRPRLTPQELAQQKADEEEAAKLERQFAEAKRKQLAKQERKNKQKRKQVKPLPKPPPPPPTKRSPYARKRAMLRHIAAMKEQGRLHEIDSRPVPDVTDEKPWTDQLRSYRPIDASSDDDIGVGP